MAASAGLKGKEGFGVLDTDKIRRRAERNRTL
jgi:hypothetical protein